MITKSVATLFSISTHWAEFFQGVEVDGLDDSLSEQLATELTELEMDALGGTIDKASVDAIRLIIADGRRIEAALR